MNHQQAMKAKLQSLGLPFREVECYGSQIVVTSHCRTTADKWASLLSKFSKVRGVIESSEDAVENKGTCLLPTQVRVWRTYATV